MIRPGRWLLSVAMRGFVMALDRLLRWMWGIFEFCDEPACLFRLSLSQSDVDVVLSDGTHVYRGDAVGEIHLWNEHVPPMGAAGPDLGWGARFYRQVLTSLQALAAYVERAEAFTSVQAFRVEVGFLQQEDVPMAVQLLERLGFDIQHESPPTTRWGRFVRFWENLYTWWLMWTFQPASLQGKHFNQIARFHMWISRAELLTRYGEATGSS